jgi:hypothetical protein
MLATNDFDATALCIFHDQILSKYTRKENGGFFMVNNGLSIKEMGQPHTWIPNQP